MFDALCMAKESESYVQDSVVFAGVLEDAC